MKLYIQYANLKKKKKRCTKILIKGIIKKHDTNKGFKQRIKNYNSIKKYILKY